MSVQQQAYDNNRHTTTGARKQQPHDNNTMTGSAAHFHAGTAMGREPQQGTDGKQEQGQPWVESQIRGWKAGAGTAMGRVPICGNGRQVGTGQQGHFCFAERERTTARQQGHFCFAERGRTVAGWQGHFCFAERGRTAGQHLRTGSRSSKGAEGKQGSI